MEAAGQGGGEWGAEVGPLVAIDLPFLSTLLLALLFLLFVAGIILLFLILLCFLVWFVYGVLADFLLGVFVVLGTGGTVGVKEGVAAGTNEVGGGL